MSDVPQDFVSMGCAARPDGVALTDGRHRFTYRQLDARVTEVAAKLAALGTAAGAVVATRVGPSVSGILLAHAVWRTGATFAPLHPGWTSHEAEDAVRVLKPTLMLDDTTAQTIESAAPATEWSAAPMPEIAAILWTSGTGGSRRGIEIRTSGLLHNAQSCAQRLNLRPDDRWYTSLQLAHIGGLALVTRAAMLGSTVFASHKFGARELAGLLRSGDVTHASLVPVMLRALLNETPGEPAPATVRALLVGGAPAGDALVREARDRGWPIALTYGMTEATSQVTTATPAEVARDAGSVGRPLAGVEVRISADGEIVVRGPTLARGVYGDKTPLTDSDGWYATGDLGRLDKTGRLTVTGRTSTRIVTGGTTVDPEEVAAILSECDGVQDCVVFGVPDPDWGEVVAAALEPTPGRALDLDEIRGYQSERLASAKRARRFVVLEALPRNANGKVDLARVRASVETDVRP